ncbi:hypothetical protein XANCAGTX0491_003942 [Xanthoria calcicola]
MAWSFGDRARGKPFSSCDNLQNKPLREVPYTKEFDDRYYSLMETQASLRMYLGTLYREYRALTESLSQKQAASNLQALPTAREHQSSAGSGPDANASSSDDNNDGRAVKPTNGPPSLEFENRPLLTLTDIDNDADDDINHPTSDDKAEIRNVNRLIVSQNRDMVQMQQDIALLEEGIENLKLQVERIEIGVELQRRRAPTATLIDPEEVKVGESYRGMSEEMEGIQLSNEGDECSGFEGRNARSVEEDEHADSEKAVRARMQFIESTTPRQEYLNYLQGKTTLQEYTKRLESQMAESVETAKRKREIDEAILKGEREARLGETQSPFAKKPQVTQTSHGLPLDLNHTEARW